MNYAGDLTPHAAWAKLGDGAILVDVRTDDEWAHTGIPDTKATENDPLFIQWNLAGGLPNQQFMAQLKQQAPETGGTELLFLCRSGARSVAAAIVATEAGFTSFNILEGFEGEPDHRGERTVNGWKNRGLPTNLGQH